MPYFHDQQQLGKAEFEHTLIDPRDEALPFSQKSSRSSTTSSLDFRGE